MKKCIKCKLEKDMSEFHNYSYSKDGKKSTCKVCILGKIPHKPIIEGLKLCKNCGESKEIGLFSKIGNTYSTNCKKCLNAKRALRRIQNPEKEKARKRKQTLKSKYNLELEEYNKMLNNQENRCKICGDFKKILNIDHCHKTGKVRGLLCTNCNLGLGSFKDDIKILMRAILYLK